MASDSLPDLGDAIDAATFEQILEMDDDEDREFSRSIVVGFFEQADQTLASMGEALQNHKITDLGSHGHFLKGSSATLGLIKVRDTCEKIQHLGNFKDELGDNPFTDEHEILRRVHALCQTLQADVGNVRQRLYRYYNIPQ